MKGMARKFWRGAAWGAKTAFTAAWKVGKACIFTLGVGTAILLVVASTTEEES